MKNQYTPIAVTRREFLRGSMGGLGLVAFSGFAPSFLTSTARADVARPETGRQILVMIQLAGGNDGLNTCIPFQDDMYYNLRPDLGIKEGYRPISDFLALHPNCAGMERLYKDGNLSIIQNVGYPNPNRSHFRSTEIWETATDSDIIGRDGWLGRYFDNACDGDGHTSSDPMALHISDDTPGHFMSEKPHSIFGMPARGRIRKKNEDELALLEKLTQAPSASDTGSYLQHMMMDAIVTEKRVQNIVDRYKPQAKYQGNLGQSLQKVAAMIAAGLETRVYFVAQGGYDTHANQANGHSQRLGELSNALHAFQQDLIKHKLDDQVLTVVFSEFGRRPQQNGSQGTDHGAAAPLFVMGRNLQTPLLGEVPDLQNLQNNDLRHEYDFRQVYASVIQDWFKADPSLVLDGQFDTLPII
ncbi:DUF1501 domain-containing protein [Cerasicoccus arenae]|uniref:DUF1501 domain-containing protein n=1 Tax=Cerasicoccus arenae TaxID=424488 RepID=A0A8J3DHH8_9BACT|nr:DUF1501 domain-containing protein [Cerasicoccus arenae]MBK1857416.1 DUF1501 domain-containing protein [Cerasicoccus arenae]GHC07850.1 hypothetical protein GCM10007047_26320 [Cerasicoccus arenae]